MVLVLALKGRRAADGGPLARSLAPLFLNGTLYSQCDGDGPMAMETVSKHLFFHGRMNSYVLPECYELFSFGVAENI